MALLSNAWIRLPDSTKEKATVSEQTIIDGIDYGPLAVLVGIWKGDKGVDRAPA